MMTPEAIKRWHTWRREMDHRVKTAALAALCERDVLGDGMEEFARLVEELDADETISTPGVPANLLEE
jgi:hypothetical protein